jgi:hypothetical protein
MADWETDFEFLMKDEDRAQAHAIVQDAPNIYKTNASGNQVRVGAYALSGINSAAYPEDFATIAALPQAERGPAVDAFYKKNFFNKWEAQLSDPVEERILSHMVNRGPVAGVKVLQTAVDNLGGGIAVDGAWGPATVAAANACDQDALVEAVRSARLADYEALVARNPADAIYLGTEANPGPWRLRALA